MDAIETALKNAWFAPTLIALLPVLLQYLSYVQDNFLYKEKDFIDDAGLLESTNKVGKAKSLKTFVENRFLDTSFEDGSDDNLLDKCMDLTGEITRRTGLDISLGKLKRFYSVVCRLLFVTSVASISVAAASLISIALFPGTRVLWFFIAVILAIASIIFVTMLRVCTEKLNKMKQNEDLKK